MLRSKDGVYAITIRSLNITHLRTAFVLFLMTRIYSRVMYAKSVLQLVISKGLEIRQFLPIT